MSRLRERSCLHFWNMNGVISLIKLSDMISVRKFGHRSKPPFSDWILFMEMSRWTSML